MHGHLWNADVYQPNPLVYMYVCWLLPAFMFICALSQTMQHLHSVVDFKCVVLGAFTPVDLSNSNQVLGIFHRCPVNLNKKKNVIETLMYNK